MRGDDGYSEVSGCGKAEKEEGGMHVILRRAVRPELAQGGRKTLSAVSLLDVLRRNGRGSSSGGSRRGGGHLGVRNVRRRLGGAVRVLEDRHFPHLIRHQTHSESQRSLGRGWEERTDGHVCSPWRSRRSPTSRRQQRRRRRGARWCKRRRGVL